MTYKLLLKVFTAGRTPAAVSAIDNLQALCAELREADSYDIEIIDIRQQPQRAETERILATPTVVRELPPPVKRLVGDLSNREQVISSLELLET